MNWIVTLKNILSQFVYPLDYIYYNRQQIYYK